jgi:hypothetical protein
MSLALGSKTLPISVGTTRTDPAGQAEVRMMMMMMMMMMIETASLEACFD